MLLTLHHSHLIVLAAGWAGRGKPHVNEPITAEAALTLLTQQNITTETRKMPYNYGGKITHIARGHLKLTESSRFIKRRGLKEILICISLVLGGLYFNVDLRSRFAMGYSRQWAYTPVEEDNYIFYPKYYLNHHQY